VVVVAVEGAAVVVVGCPYLLCPCPCPCPCPCLLSYLLCLCPWIVQGGEKRREKIPSCTPPGE